MRDLLSHSHAQITAELTAASADQLRDATLLGGLLIAAASAAGLSPTAVPAMRQDTDGGVSGVLLLDQAHIAIHTVPERRTLLFDAVAPASHDFRKAVEVFARRLAAGGVTSDFRGRG